jgi:hypothetical protein
MATEIDDFTGRLLTPRAGCGDSLTIDGDETVVPRSIGRGGFCREWIGDRRVNARAVDLHGAILDEFGRSDNLV